MDKHMMLLAIIAVSILSVSHARPTADLAVDVATAKQDDKFTGTTFAEDTMLSPNTASFWGAIRSLASITSTRLYIMARDKLI